MQYANSPMDAVPLFTHGIVRTPGSSLVDGLTTAGLGLPNYELALQQHAQYIQALQACGLQVRVLEPDEAFPDSTFVEDIALLTPHCAILTNPGAPSRQGETGSILPVLEAYYTNIEIVQPPGTVEAGDIMMVGSHYYIGLSARTNLAGARQVIGFLQKYGLSGSHVKLKKVLHLKTGVAYLEHNNLVACGEFLNNPVFQKFNLIPIDPDESYAANCVWINDRVMIPAGYPKARKAIEEAGYTTIQLQVSEFRKLDGGLSCLSLRF
jgi:dimethylargininase